MMKTHKFARKPFYVDAVRVSEANLTEVAEWAEGTVEETEDGQVHVKVKVHRPLTDRQTQAFVGDWVLFAGTGYKVYTPKAFDKSFEKVKTLTKAQADEAGIRPGIEPKKPRTGTVGQALLDAQAKKAPVPTPPKRQRTPEEIKEAQKAVDFSSAHPGEQVEVAPGISMVTYGEPTAEQQEEAVKVISEAKLESVSVVSAENALPGTEIYEVAADTPASDAIVQENAVAAAPAPQFSEIVVDREIPRIYTEDEKDANAEAAIQAVLDEG